MGFNVQVWVGLQDLWTSEGHAVNNSIQSLYTDKNEMNTYVYDVTTNFSFDFRRQLPSVFIL